MNPSSLKILLVEDDLSFQITVKRMLASVGTVVSASTLREARNLIHREAFDLCLLDYQLPDGYGLDLMNELRKFPDHGPVIFISGHENRIIISRCLNLGAVDYIPKTDHFETDLLTRIPLAIRRAQNLRRQAELEERYRRAFRCEIIGESPPIQNLKTTISNLTGERINSILIEGDSGTGKELVARRLNVLENRNRPFIMVNCSSITESNFEMEFFGYSKAPFAQAQQARAGYVELAMNGDLFLDEITDLTLICQSKLAQFLSQREYVPVGGTAFKQACLRVLSSSTKNLQEALKSGEICKELYHTLTDHCITLPRLRDLGEDIKILSKYFLSYCGNLEITISEEVFSQFAKHDWPGNVRELEQVIRNAYLNAKMRSSKVIQKVDLNGFQTSDPVKVLLPREKNDISKESYMQFMHSVEQLYWKNAFNLFDGNASKFSRESGFSLSTINSKIRDFDLRENAKGLG